MLKNYNYQTTVKATKRKVFHPFMLLTTTALLCKKSAVVVNSRTSSNITLSVLNLYRKEVRISR
jgi:hypothetical protein